MTTRWRLRLAVLASAPLLAVLAVSTAEAHPLGNFTVNHYDGLVLSPHLVTDRAIVDSAEIPTQQALRDIDADGDGEVTTAERAAYGASQCARLAGRLTLSVAGRPAVWSVKQSSYGFRTGAAGLRTGRLECDLAAAVDLTVRSRVAFTDNAVSARIGWHEITARGDGTHLVRAPVPASSVTDELRHYPNDLLASPLDVRSVSLDVVPGAGVSTVVAGRDGEGRAGLLSRTVERLNRFFSGLAGSRHLTLGVGLLAVLVSLLLGAAHAALPGHGKTVMAAYLAGKRGSVRDAVVVGATVTATHTVGVLALGLALTASSSLAGEDVTRDLGIVSGALVAAVGVGLLRSALRRPADPHGHAHAHPHDHTHPHNHAHPHDHAHPRRTGRMSLVGMGVAGGLVPSPSALVVLLGAIALGRTWFGVLLVLTYGVGMAGTLTAAGLLLVRASARWGGRLSVAAGRRIASATPVVTAGLVTVVGVGLAARSLVAI